MLNKYQYRQLKVLYVLFGFVMVLSLAFGSIETQWDTVTYFDAWNSLKSGKIDIFRTPLYPAFIGLISDIVGVKLRAFVIALIQYVVFGASIKYFYITASYLMRRGRIPFIISLLYILSPSTSLWASCVMTESLAVSLTVIWLYTIAKIWYEGFDFKSGVVSMLMLILLLLLRPGSIYLLPACVVYCVLWRLMNNKDGKLALIKVVLIFTVPFAIEGAYGIVYKSTYGVFSASSVTTFNNLEILRQKGIFDFPEVKDQNLRDALNAYQEKEAMWKIHDLNDIYDEYGMETVNSAVTTQMLKNDIYIKLFLGNLYRLVYSGVYGAYTPTVSLNYVLVLFALSGRSIVLLTLIFIIYMTWAFCHGKKPWLELCIMLIVLSNLFTSLVGAQSDWIRLFSPSAPILFIFMGILANNFTLYRPKLCIFTEPADTLR